MQRIIAIVAFIVALAALGEMAVTAMTATSFYPAGSAVGPGFWKERNSAVADAGMKAIPAQLPGPDDHWAGGEPKSLVIPLPYSSWRDARVTLAFLDSHNEHPPTLEVAVEGEIIARLDVPAGAASDHWSRDGIPSQFDFDVPVEGVSDGTLTVTITSRAGSWVAIDHLFIRPWTPDEVYWAFATAIAYLLWWGWRTTEGGRFRASAVVMLSRGVAVIDTPWRAAILLFLLLSLLLLAARESVVPFGASTDRARYFLTGDEPRYLLGAYSIAHDGDVNIFNNRANKDWERFFTHDIWPAHGHLSFFQKYAPAMRDVPPESWHEKQLMVLRPGLSFLVAPSTYTDHIRWWAYTIITTFCVLLLALMVPVAARWGVSPLKAGAMVTLIGLSPPGYFYFNQVYPENPVGVLLAFIVLLLLTRDRRLAIIVGLAVIAGPWFSDRAVLGGAILGVGALFLFRERPARVALTGIYVLGATALAAYYLDRFGVPYPVNHNPHMTSITLVPEHILPYLFDGSKGMLWQAPFLVALPAAFVAWWRHREERLVLFLTLVTTVATVLVSLSNFDWWGGSCPPARYGVIVQWLALPPFLAWVRVGISSVAWWLMAPAFLWQLFSSFMLAGTVSWWYAHFNPLLHYRWMGWLDAIFPNLSYGSKGDPVKLATAMVAFSLYALLIFMASRRKATGA